jgi:glycosyltransferase involved in cell wall biosynthesis
MRTVSVQAAGWAGRHVVLLNWRDLDHPLAGGAEMFAERVAARFAAGGARVTIFSSLAEGLPARTERGGVTIRRAGGALSVYARALLWVRRNRRDIDAVIDCQNGIPFFSPLAVRRTTPVVQVVHHVHTHQFRLFFGPVAAFFGRNLEGRCARLAYRGRPTVCVSPSTRTDALEQLNLFGPRFLVPNGLDVPGAPVATRIRSEYPSIVCVGRMVPQKRLDLLIDALPVILQAVPDLRVELIGEGPELERLQERARSRAVDTAVTFHGRLGSIERDELLRQAWLTVNPTRLEGWGLSVIEAAAMGVPALAFRVPGLRDSIRDDLTGWLLDESEPLGPAVAAKLGELSDPAMAVRYAKACHEWARSFTWHRSGELMAAVLGAEKQRLLEPGAERRQWTRGACIVSVTEPVPDAYRATDIAYVDRGEHLTLLYDALPDQAVRALRRRGCDVIAARPATDEDLLIAVTSSARRD